MAGMDIQATLKERGGRYGAFRQNAAVSVELKKVLGEALARNPRWGAVPDDLKRTIYEGLDNVSQKLARAVTGDPTYDDNWRDISGYGTLVLEEIERAAKLAASEQQQGVAPQGATQNGGSGTESGPIEHCNCPGCRERRANFDRTYPTPPADLRHGTGGALAHGFSNSGRPVTTDR